ncbi:substrate-binding domain-containing protein [Rhizobium sp. CFBP 8762]|uniref:substrate-binding domain-containing protein n=1 Tax=Rhizobium sp. CFBP 8762 TaxID=2775279 RepID=UPI00177B277F|nr:substrate-binding domain-containing protein [Rhizobium sp. CFBP 8762]MBD8554499.1 substrate-binding domain-containing protein [Rhizobium sp. CFBP 8762]
MANDSKKKATIYDLSVLSGISASTVSAVLNGTWRKRRIKESTASLIRALAEEHNYTANRQAQGLRSSRSGLVGLMLPVYDNRYFSSMAQTFEAYVRERGQCPIVVSTTRDPDEERRTAETLISYSIDQLFICGATDPDGVHDVCKAAGLRHINIDLPGTKAHSVISDNYEGSRVLTKAIIEQFPADNPLSADDLCLFGGRNDHASRERIRGFRDIKLELLGGSLDDAVQPTGYSPETARLAYERFFNKTGRLPRAMFINSSINFEGLLRFMAGYPHEVFADIVVGCYDYDPFGSFLPFPVLMMRQDVEGIVRTAFELIDNAAGKPEIHMLPSRLVLPRTALEGPLDKLRDVLLGNV